MHKLLMLLGLLRQGPMSGYDLHRFVRSHGTVSADLKKANVYYLLDRLAADGYLHVQAEAGARGPRGERLIYTLTDLGRARFDELLREVLRSYDTVHTGVDVAVMFLGQLTQDDAPANAAHCPRSSALPAGCRAGLDGTHDGGIAQQRMGGTISEDAGATT